MKLREEREIAKEYFKIIRENMTDLEIFLEKMINVLLLLVVIVFFANFFIEVYIFHHLSIVRAIPIYLTIILLASSFLKFYIDEKVTESVQERIKKEDSTHFEFKTFPVVGPKSSGMTIRSIPEKIDETRTNKEV